MKAALRENRLPFPLEAGPYFTGETLRVLEQRKKAFDDGKQPPAGRIVDFGLTMEQLRCPSRTIFGVTSGVKLLGSVELS